MANRNLDITPRELIHDIRQGLKAEREIRRSLKIASRPEYVANQSAHFEQLAAEFQAKARAVKEKARRAPQLLAESQERTDNLKLRLFVLLNRKRFERLKALQQQAELLAKELKE